MKALIGLTAAAIVALTAGGIKTALPGTQTGPEPTEGELIAATRMHYSLRRTDPRAGTVHVHFPRIGYVLRKVENA